MLVTCFAVCCLACLCVCGNLEWFDGPKAPISRWILALLICCGVVTLFSPAVFLKDHQKDHYRFFHQNREHPTAFWFARLTPWVVLVAGLVVVLNLPLSILIAELDSERARSLALGPFGAYPNDLMSPRFFERLVEGAVWLPAFGLMAALGCGQFWSMFIRNPIINTVVTVVSSILLLYYGSYLFCVNENVALFALPIIVALFLATYVRSRQWLADRKSVVLWFAPMAAIALTAAIMFGAMVFHRATEYPDIKFDFGDLSEIRPNHDFQNFVVGSAKERVATASLYRQALELAKPHATGRPYFDFIRSDSFQKEMVAFHSARKPAIDLILKAAQSPVCDPFLRSIARADNPELSVKELEALRVDVAEECWLLISLIYVDYLKHKSEGELDQALESLLAHNRIQQRVTRKGVLVFNDDYRDFCRRIIEWAELPGQKPELLKKAIFELEGPQLEGPKLDSGSDEKTSEYTFYQPQACSSEVAIERQINSDEAEQSFRIGFRHKQLEGKLFSLYSEFQDPDGLFNSFASWDVERGKRIQKHLSAELFWRVWSSTSVRNDLKIYNSGALKSRDGSFAKVANDPTAYLYQVGGDWVMRPMRTEARLRRYTLLRLALAMHQIETGEYPQTLYELKKYFANGLPKAPDGGHSFGWFPNGLGKKLFIGDSNALTMVCDDPNTPILLPYAAVDSDEVQKRDYVNSDGDPVPADEIHLHSLWRFSSLGSLVALKKIETGVGGDGDREIQSKE